MFGIRTPPSKDAKESERRKFLDELSYVAGPSSKDAIDLIPRSVRRSVGEWETGQPESQTRKRSPPKKPATVEGQRPKPVGVRRASAEAAGSPPKQERPKASDRLVEARACVTKAKLHLGNSRNLKSEIKAEVTLAIDRLYQLIKDSESAKGNISKAIKEPEKEKKKDLEEQNGRDSEIVRTIEEHSRLLRENTEKMKELKETLETKTYASAAATPIRKQLPEQTALHSVVVTAKREGDTAEDILNKIRKAANATEGGIAIERVRKAKDQKVIVGCRTEEEREKIKEKLKKAQELNVEDIQNKDPLVILKDVLQHNSDEEVLKALRNQNRGLFKDLDRKDDRMEIAYKRRTRNPHTSHIVLRVSPKLWRRIVQTEAVHVDLQRVRAADQSPLVQCSLCLGYGHGRRFCKETLEKCSHCGGPHLKTQCADYLAGEQPTCCNCMHAKIEKTAHNAFSSECSIRRKWEALARATVAYC